MSGKKSTTAKSLTTKRSTKKPRVTKLKVEDAETLPDFLKNARKVWNAKQPYMKRSGRPSEANKILGILSQAKIFGKIPQKPTQGKLFKFVEVKLGSEGPHQDTILKYVKLWWTAYTKGPAAYESDDFRIWLGTNNLDVEYDELLDEFHP